MVTDVIVRLLQIQADHAASSYCDQVAEQMFGYYNSNQKFNLLDVSDTRNVSK